MLQETVHNRLIEASQAFSLLCPSKEAKSTFDDLMGKLLEVPLRLHTNGDVVKVKAKRLFIAMPHHGSVEVESCMAALINSVPREMSGVIQTTFKQLASSLLANCFNKLWCDCLNDHDADYFLMLHADIAPAGHFAVDLIEKLEEYGFDVLHATSPIKDNHGVYSTALGTSDPWGPTRKLTGYEAEKLPETFNAEDMLDVMGREETLSRDPGPWMMLPNTGCMLVKLGQWAYSFPGFCIIDRIIRVEAQVDANGRIIKDAHRKITQEEAGEAGGSGKPFRLYPQVAPEDWNFGRWCHARGLKVGGTKKVRLGHFGRWNWVNTGSWGQWLQDEGFLALAKAEANGAAGKVEDGEDPLFPSDVRGWLSPSEGAALRRWAAGKRVLEIGAYCGKSTICLAQSATRVDTIDPFDGRATPHPDSTITEFMNNIKKYGVDQKVVPWRGTSETEIPKMGVGIYSVPSNEFVKFDLVFIDGAHDLASVKRDIRLSLPMLTPDGLLAFHDYKRDIDPEVTKAVDEFIAAGAEIVEYLPHIVLIKSPKGV